MPMLDVQRRHADVYRIRLGDKGSRGQPQKLTDSIRITSPNALVVQAFADVFGGTVKPWDGQFEVYLPTTELPIMVLPGQSISQWWELYRGSVCERRCDGDTETLSGRACMCPADITERMAAKGACRPMTRVNVVCPDVAVVGAGSLVTHGLVAAETLPQSIAVAEAALARGLMVPAVLRVVEHKGKTHYIVPQIEIVGVSLTQLTTGEIPTPAAVAAAPAPKAIAAPAQHVERTRPPAMAKVKDTKPLPEPKPAARPLPPLPNEVDTAAAKAARDLETERSRMYSLTLTLGDTQRPLLRKDWEKADLPKITALSTEQVAVGRPILHKWVALSALERAGFTSEKDRHKAVSDATGGETESTKDLSVEQLANVLEFCEAVAETQPVFVEAAKSAPAPTPDGGEAA